MGAGFHTGMMNTGEIVTTHLQYTTKLVLNLNLVGGGELLLGGGFPPFPHPPCMKPCRWVAIIHVQWILSIVVTLGTQKTGCYKEVTC